MTIPQVKISPQLPFPTLTIGAAGIKVTKLNGVWTIRLDYTALAQLTPPTSDYPNTLIMSYNTTSKIYSTISLTLLQAAAQAVSPTFVTVAGTYAALSTDTDILINKTVPAANSVQLQASAARNGIPLFIKDYPGNAATNNITILPNGTEKIDGLSLLLINANYGGFLLVPLAVGGWYIKGA